MINRKNTAGESGYSNPFVLAITAIAICGALAMGAAAGLTPAAATPNVSTECTAAHESPFAYFPEQYVNQATEIEPMPSTF
jgi:hypothetical protein